MKKLFVTMVAAAALVGCSKEDATPPKVAANSSVAQDAQNCSGGSISAGQFYMSNNTWGSSRAGSGSQCSFYNNINDWGTDAKHTNVSTGIKSYPSIVYGCHWGSCSSGTALPKKISALGNVRTWWSQSASGASYDSAYDIWFDPSANPGNRASKYELMIWLQWNGTKPLADKYNASGAAVPFASNVSLSGKTWNVYRKDNVFSFLPTSQTGWLSIDVKPIINYCVDKGWMPSSSYMTSVEAGWEITAGGTYRTTSFGVSNI